MTASADLPALLQRARKLLPDRVKFVGSHIAQVMYMGSKRAISWDEPETLVWLEMACREEIEARGWTCVQDFAPHPRLSRALVVIYTPNWHSASRHAHEHPGMDSVTMRVCALLDALLHAVRNPHYELEESA